MGKGKEEREWWRNRGSRLGGFECYCSAGMVGQGVRSRGVRAVWARGGAIGRMKIFRSNGRLFKVGRVQRRVGEGGHRDAMRRRGISGEREGEKRRSGVGNGSARAHHKAARLRPRAFGTDHGNLDSALSHTNERVDRRRRRRRADGQRGSRRGRTEWEGGWRREEAEAALSGLGARVLGEVALSQRFRCLVGSNGRKGCREFYGRVRLRSPRDER